MGLTLKPENALFAEESLRRTNIQGKSAVAESAPVVLVGIKGIKSVGKAPVYNMEVDDCHNFSVNGGIIVHNCMDAVRYFVQTIMRREVRAYGIS